MSNYFRNDRGRIVTNSSQRLIDYWNLTKQADLGDFQTKPNISPRLNSRVKAASA